MNLIPIEHLNRLVKFIPTSIHGAGMNFTKQFRLSMDIRFTSSRRAISTMEKCIYGNVLIVANLL
jgi:hypothetical protein